MKYLNSFNDESSKKAFLGAIVADSATMPLHWIYDSEKLVQSIVAEDKSKCEFNSVPSCPYYGAKDFPGHYEVGQPTPNGEQFLALCKIVQESTVHDGDAYASQFHAWLQTYTGRKDGPAELFEKNYNNGLKYPQCGADDDQATSLFKAVISVICGVELEPLVRFHQNNDVAADSATFMYSLLKASTTSHSDKSLKTLYDELKGDAPESLKEHLLFLEDYIDSSTNDFIVAWGNKYKSGEAAMIPFSCHNPQAFLRVLHVSLRAKSFEEGIRVNILVGGSNALTSIAIGSLLALYFDIPEDWIKQTKSLF